MSLSVVILAAGQGVRMQSSLPKMLHPIGGIPVLERLLSTVSQINPKQAVIVQGHKGDQLKQFFAKEENITWAEQKEQLGTGHAVLQALPHIQAVDSVLITYGDIPLITVETLQELLKITQKDEIGFVTVTLKNPKGFGRIIRNQNNQVERIVEEKEATLSEKEISEINAGFFIVPKKFLEKALPKIMAHNTTQEFYLPEIISLAFAEGITIRTVSPQNDFEVMGFNDKEQLAELERIFQYNQAKYWMQQGVTLMDPKRFDVRGDIQIGKDVVIDVNVILEGKVVIGDRVKIGPNVYLKNTTIQNDVQILANSVIEEASVGKACQIGPFSRIRPGTVLEEQARVGNFVEIKNSTVGAASKINHLSYVGDASVGKEVNVGAGTITCNYDGKRKNRTVIGDRVFIGSDTQLIAPVTIGEGVTIGAGTTVVKDIPPNYLVHNRIEHRHVENWARESDKELD